jgi:hypothetical protein
MPDVHIHLPELEASDLVFDEGETRAILRFFWPGLSQRINGLPSIDDEFRKLAQGLLIVAIDSSFAMGFVHILFDVLRHGGKPGFPGLRSMAKKLARKYVPHWWKHTRPQDLDAVRIYESVRRAIALNFKAVIDIMLAEHTSANAGAILARAYQMPLRIPSMGDRSYWA